MEAYIYDKTARLFRFFSKPKKVFKCTSESDVISALQEIERLVYSFGYYAIGYISYEAATAFDLALKVKTNNNKAILLCFGVFDSFSLRDLNNIPDNVDIPDWKPTVSVNDYNSAISRIKEYIRSGDTYQVNYTYRIKSEYNCDPLKLFIQMYKRQPSIYSTFIHDEHMAIVSVSPELFFSLDDTNLVSRPMKGTLPRGLTWLNDKRQAETLVSSEKMQAENVMIVDMIRNDMGRIAKCGSVHVDKLFTAERYPSLWQLTSTVSCTTNASITDIFKALFPCASITGAPKVRTMQIINELECTPRGVYTGAIGYIAPERRAQFSVAIRTVAIDKKSSAAWYGSGGGIIADSECMGEYNEALLKANIIFAKYEEFEILETLLWEKNSGYLLLEKHIDRMERSADYFDFSFDRNNVQEQLLLSVSSSEEIYLRVRLTLKKDGGVRITTSLFSPASDDFTLLLKVSQHQVSSGELFLYHKTTNRKVYDSIKGLYENCDDIILVNERNELTETTIGNILVEIDGILYTPPVECGLLAGVYRESLLKSGQIKEKVLYPCDLDMATKVLRINSVRKLERAKVIK